jgi:sn-glycerol 3-phosphate transport system substrate-binding protein
VTRLAALLLSLALVLAACSGTADPTDTADTAEDGSADTAADSGGDDAPDGDTTEIQVWIGFTDYRLDWARDVAVEFEERHPEYSVDVQGYDDYETLFQNVQLAAEQGSPPAIAQYFEVATQEARDARTPSGDPLFADLEAAIDGRDEILGEPVVLDDVVDAVRDYYTLDGQFTSMPWNTSSAILFANMTVLEEAGVDAPPATWDEVEATCEAVADLDDAPQACISWPNHGWFFEQSLGQQGATLADNDNGRSARATTVDLSSDAAIDFVQYWADLEDAGHYIYTGTQRDWGGTYNAFVAQEIPLLLYSSSDTTVIQEDGEEAGFEVLAAPMPRNADAAFAGNLIGGATLWLSEGLDEVTQDGALAFLQFFNNPENAADWHKVTGYVPITESAISLLEDEGWFDDNPNQRVAGDQIAAADGSVATQGAILGSFVAIRDVVTGAVEEILVDDVDVTERMSRATEEAQALLDDYNALFAE